jgi:AraC-like DNA-binding protein
MRFPHGPCDARSFARHRQIVEYARRADADPVLIEESISMLLIGLMRAAYASRGSRSPRPSSDPRGARRRRDCAGAARLVLLARFRERITLDALAREVGVSGYHLCRIFRAHVGESIHQYLTDLRLRASLDALCEGKSPLAMLALDCGFSSQAHFTGAFAKRFGCTPAAFRRDVRDGNLPPHRASTILEDRPRRPS